MPAPRIPTFLGLCFREGFFAWTRRTFVDLLLKIEEEGLGHVLRVLADHQLVK
jgi:hypothetical protein